MEFYRTSQFCTMGSWTILRLTLFALDPLVSEVSSVGNTEMWMSSSIILVAVRCLQQLEDTLHFCKISIFSSSDGVLSNVVAQDKSVKEKSKIYAIFSTSNKQ